MEKYIFFWRATIPNAQATSFRLKQRFFFCEAIVSSLAQAPRTPLPVRLENLTPAIDLHGLPDGQLKKKLARLWDRK